MKKIPEWKKHKLTSEEFALVERQVSKWRKIFKDKDKKESNDNTDKRISEEKAH